MDISQMHQFMYLIQDAVNIRMNTIDDRKASLFNQILPLVPGDMLFVNIPLFFQSALFLAKRDGSHSVVQCPLDIWIDYLYHSLLILPYALCEGHLSILNIYIFCSE